MNFLLEYILKFLQDTGGFYPIGACMSANGEMNTVAGYDGRDNPPDTAIIDIIKEGLTKGAIDGEFEATALAYEVLITDSSSDLKRDAISFELDHVGGYSVIVYFRYHMDMGKPVLEAPTAQLGTRKVFR